MFEKVSPKVDFVDLENTILKYWENKQVLKKYLSKNTKSDKKFSFIDGPITANNPMGVHHAWGRTYKDLWQRFFNMNGFKQRFQNGFDEQGLWVEVEVEKELGLKTKKDIENLVSQNSFASIAKFVEHCKERVKKYADIMTSQSIRLGYFMDWKNSYHTSSDQNNYAIWHYLKEVNDKGWLYKGTDSVPWCPRCGTAISQHEILTEEYKELTHDSVFLKLPVVSKPFEGTSLLVWTTTPWTIPGNVAVAVDPNKNYVVTSDDLIVMQSQAKTLGLTEKKLIKGKNLIGLNYQAPFDHIPSVQDILTRYSHTVVGAKDLVNESEGTGLVHIAPGAGEEDFKLSKEQNIPVIELIEEDASYLKGMGDLAKINAKKNPEVILDFLKKHQRGKYLHKIEKYTHRYPTCWRCKTELVWRVVDEWYISMDKSTQKSGKTYRKMLQDSIKPKNRWIPDWGYDRELDWLNNMNDWLISKKRYWGLALPIWECTDCKHFEVIGSSDELKSKAVEGWELFEGNSPHRPWIDSVKIKCSSCGKKIKRIFDVGNPWLDAGIVPFSTLKYFEDKNYWKNWFPADFITESFPGQFKNWFYSLLAMSVALENEAPFKKLLGYGSVRDELGEEMHKSKGNAIEFTQASEKIGVDVMRWLYLRTNPEHNVHFGYKTADEIRRLFHLRLWNVYSFFITYALIDKWKATKTPEKSNVLIDKWILSKMYSSISKIEEHLKIYNAFESAAIAEDFIVNDLSNWYVRRIRDRVGPAIPNSKDKTVAYSTLYQVLVTYCKVLAPFIPFVTESIFTNLTDLESVHLEDWPKPNNEMIDLNLEKNMSVIRELSEIGHGIRKKEMIKVRQPLSSFTYGKGYKKLPENLEKYIESELNVKKIIYDINSKCVLDIVITRDLEEEGLVRELIRQIQQTRKEEAIPFDRIIKVRAPNWPKKFEKEILRETLASEIIKSDKLAIDF